MSGYTARDMLTTYRLPAASPAQLLEHARGAKTSPSLRGYLRPKGMIPMKCGLVAMPCRGVRRRIGPLIGTRTWGGLVGHTSKSDRCCWMARFTGTQIWPSTTPMALGVENTRPPDSKWNMIEGVPPATIRNWKRPSKCEELLKGTGPPEPQHPLIPTHKPRPIAPFLVLAMTPSLLRAAQRSSALPSPV